MSTDRLNEKIDEMRRAYPSLRFLEAANQDGLTWEGPLCPIRSVSDLNALLDDLENDTPVEITVGEFAEIVHHPDCVVPHNDHRLTSQVEHPVREFVVRIVDFGNDRQPEASVLDSPIPSERWKHRWGDEGVCAYAPWEHPWSAADSSIVDFVDHVLIWLFKQNIYAQTEVWIGKETPHTTEFLFNTIKPVDRCYCGLDKIYENCHRIVHGYELHGDNWLIFEAWLSVQRSKPHRYEELVNRLPKRSAHGSLNKT